MILPSLYGYFAKILAAYQMPDRSEKALKPVFNFNPSLVEQVMKTMKNYSFSDVEQIILLLHDANLRSIGIGNPISTSSLMKELSYKIMNLSAAKNR